MKKLEFNYLIKKLKRIRFSKFDLIVAIGKDGIMPASLLQYLLNTPVEIIWLNYRDKNNKPIRKEPKLMKPFKKIKNKKILLVDTISRTGKTLEKAKQLLKGNKIKSFVINGKADYSVIDSKACVLMPWA